MKLLPSLAAAAIALQPVWTFAQVPGLETPGVPGPMPPTSATPAPDQVRDANEGPVTLSIMEEVFSLPIVEAASLLHDVPSDQRRYARLREMMANGKARLEKLMVLRTKSGQRAVVESIHELRFPTMPEHAPIPAASVPSPAPAPPADPAGKAPPPAEPVAGGKPKVDLPAEPTPTITFDTRNIGDSLEVEAVLGPDGKSIDLNLVPQTVRYLGERTFGDAEKSKQPIIETGKVTTSITVRDGQPYFLGTVHPPLGSAIAGQQKEQRVWLEFLTVNVVRAERAESLSIRAAATLAVAQKLMIPGLRLHESSVLDAVELLQKKSVENDPERKGVNFILEAPPALLRNRKITMALSECGLMEAVHEVAALSGLEIKPTDSGLLLRAAPEKP